MPVLFFHGEYDYVCQTVNSNLAEPMRSNCSRLKEINIKSGHWMAQEKPMEVSAGLVQWLSGEADYWVS
jgi:pimeloyl-ACP methyl ester carboxylesterase